MSGMSPTPWVKCHMIPLSEFRTHIARLTERVAHVPERILLTKHGRPFAAVVSMRDLEMIERFDGRSVSELRREFETIANRFSAAQDAGRASDAMGLSLHRSSCGNDAEGVEYRK